MRKTADAVTQCKFESTDPSSDDTVLYKILQVNISRPSFTVSQRILI